MLHLNIFIDPSHESGYTRRMSSQPRLPKLCLTIDVVFRLLFDDKEGCRLLISLLNSVLRFQGDERIADLRLVPRQLSGPGAEDKEVILDIRASTAAGRQFNVEVQMRFHDSYPERILYYWSGMYHGQLAVGETYDQLQAAYSVQFLGFRYLPDQAPFTHYHHEYRVLCRETGHCLTPHLRIHMVELVKFHASLAELVDEEQKWVYFLKHGHEMDPHEVAQLGVPEIAEADRRLDMISQDQILRIQAEMRDKAQRDALSFGHDKWRYGERRFNEGIQEGRKDGFKEGRQEELRLSIATICELLDIPWLPEYDADLARLDVDALTSLRTQLTARRAWPEA